MFSGKNSACWFTSSTWADGVVRELLFWVLLGLATALGVVLFGDRKSQQLFVQAMLGIAWPLTVVVIAVLFKQPLVELLRAIESWEGFGTKAKFGRQETQTVAVTAPDPTPMETRILNTLWTKQVNRFAQWPQQRFMFNPGTTDPSFEAFLNAAHSLIGRGMIAFSPDQRMFFLTDHGFEYCQRTHKNFAPDDQWWPEEKINRELVEKAEQWTPA